MPEITETIGRRDLVEVIGRIPGLKIGDRREITRVYANGSFSIQVKNCSSICLGPKYRGALKLITKFKPSVERARAKYDGIYPRPTMAASAVLMAAALGLMHNPQRHHPRIFR